MSEQDRKKILFVSVFLLMSFVIYLWVDNLNAVLNTSPVVNSEGEEPVASPFKIFSDKVSMIAGTILDEINLIK